MKTLLLTLMGLASVMLTNGQFQQIPGATKNATNPSENLQASNGMQSLFNMNKTGLSFSSASVVLGQRGSLGGVPQPADFTIQGIPAGAIIEKAYLWSTMSGSGVSVSVQITDPQSNTTGFVMDTIGSGPDKCWGYPGTFNYRADVTSAITGNGVYIIDGFPVSATIGAEDTDGATLMVIYSDPAQSWTGTLVLYDGIYAINGGTINQDITGFSVTSNTNAKAFTIIGDVQNDYDITVNGQLFSLLTSSSGKWWNMDVFPISLNTGSNTLPVIVSSSADCYDWIVAGLYYSPQVSGMVNGHETAAFNLINEERNKWKLLWQHLYGNNTWSLYDSNGRLCKTGSFGSPTGHLLLDLNDQHHGLYVLQLNNGRHTYTSKLVVF